MTTPASPVPAAAPTPAVMTYNAPAPGTTGGTITPRGTIPGSGAVKGAGRAVSPRSNAARIADRLPRSQRFWRSQPSLGAPGWLTDRRVILVAWATGLVLIGIDEFQSGYVLPRPLRLWSASGVYLILAAAGTIEAVVPLANALALGFTFTLAFQYYNNEGQFSAAAKGGAGGKAPGASGSGSANSGGSGSQSPPQPFNGTPGFPGGIL